MQGTFDFDDRPGRRWLEAVQDRLRRAFGAYVCDWRLTPVQQLIKSIISSRTLDKDSWAAFWRLWERYGSAEAISAARFEEIEAAIAGVTWPDQKAAWVKTALLQLRERRRDFDLSYLAQAPVEEAMNWLQALAGVGPKVAAAVLNFSPLDRRVLVIDGHVHRVLQRLGLARERDGVGATLARVMREVPEGWTGADLMELHVHLKRIGQTLCRAGRADCARCPLAAECAWPARQQARRWRRQSQADTFASI